MFQLTAALLYAGGRPLYSWLFDAQGGVFFKITTKIAGQIAKRGWTEELIEQVINHPSEVGTSVNRATGNFFC
jgi:colicin-like ribonuclease protein